MAIVKVYDPPSGWLYGFPKPYKPLPGESLADTLRRDGYPEHEIKSLGKHLRARFFNIDTDLEDD